MLFGVCCGPDKATLLSEMGYDYFEWSVGGLLKPEEPEAAFEVMLEQVRNAPLPCPVVNCFVPGHLKITGSDVNFTALESYVKTACRRAKVAKVDTIVFGSGGARCIPDGFGRDEAMQQLEKFCRMIAPIARENDVTIVLEPLCKKECNVFTAIGESAAMVRTVDHLGFRLLIDAYHWGTDNDSYDDLVEAAPLLQHAHIATYTNRKTPGVEECNFVPFFKALATGGYDGRISIEGSIGDWPAELPIALELMKKLC